MRGSLNYHDEYVFEIGEEPEEDLYLDEQLQLDFTATFRFSPRWSVSAAAQQSQRRAVPGLRGQS